MFAAAGEDMPVSHHNVVSAMEKAMPADMREKRIPEGLSFHSYRHFFNTYLLSENVPPHKVRTVMGHSEGRGTTTETYTVWRPEMFPEVYEAQEKLMNYLDIRTNEKECPEQHSGH